MSSDQVELLHVASHLSGALLSGDYHVRRQELFAPCPFCGDQKEHFSIHVRSGLYHCFKCKAGGCLRIEPSTRDLRSQLLRLASEEQDRPAQYVGVEPLPEVARVLDEGTDDRALASIARKVFAYCASRGMSPAQLRRYRVSCKPFVPRAFFPYWSDGRVCCYVARSIVDGFDPKVVEVGGIKPLFGRHVEKHRQTVVLVEGVFDHLATPQSYAMLGSTITNEQADTLARDGVRSVLLICDPDAEPAAEVSQQRLMRRRILCHRCVLLDTDKDPAALGRRKMAAIISELLATRLVRPQRISIITQREEVCNA